MQPAAPLLPFSWPAYRMMLGSMHRPGPDLQAMTRSASRFCGA